MIVINRCWLCESDGESVDHLLLHCEMAKELYACWWSGGR
jgi:hypothetical protein